VTTTRASWLELSEDAYAANVAAFRALAGPARRLGAVLKGNAYGHGLLPTLGLAHGRVDVLHVIRPEEALTIRAWEVEHGRPRREVLVIGAVTPEECVALARVGVQVVAASADFGAVAAEVRAAGLTLRVHLHLDTGLSREGFSLAELQAGAADFLLADADVLSLTGVLSHFANTEDVTEQAYAQAQLARFDEGLAALARRVPVPPTVQRHLAASAAALVLPASRLDLLRVGIALYGLWPSSETRLSARVVLGEVPALEPVLAWRAKSQLVRWLPAGAYVGYGCTYRCAAATRVAVLPVGYWDGYPRLASGVAHALVRGQRCPVLGRVMMNHLVVDVTHAVADEAPLVATLVGRDGAESIAAETLAGWAQTIHYELVTRLGTHLERRVLPSHPRGSLGPTPDVLR
jgi:alanine racemase